MKLQYQGKEIEAEGVAVTDAKEYWNEYKLSDGNTLRIKVILV